MKYRILQRKQLKAVARLRWGVSLNPAAVFRVKFLASHLLRDAGGRKRFEREAKAAASLNHPNICTVYEIDEVNEHLFIAMEFVEAEHHELRGAGVRRAHAGAVVQQGRRVFAGEIRDGQRFSLPSGGAIMGR